MRVHRDRERRRDHAREEPRLRCQPAPRVEPRQRAAHRRAHAIEPATREERERRVRGQPVLGAAEDGRLRQKERTHGDRRTTRKRSRSVSSRSRAAPDTSSRHQLPRRRALADPEDALRPGDKAPHARGPALEGADHEEHQRHRRHRRQRSSPASSSSARAVRSSSGRDIRCCSTRDSGGTRTTTAARPSVSFQRYGQSAKNTIGPITPSTTRLAGIDTRPARRARRIARRWMKSACGTSTAGRIHALCFVSSVRP